MGFFFHFCLCNRQATTIVESFYVIGGELQTDYGPRNGYRMPAYHRWDISATLNNKPGKNLKAVGIFQYIMCIREKSILYLYHMGR